MEDNNIQYTHAYTGCSALGLKYLRCLPAKIVQGTLFFLKHVVFSRYFFILYLYFETHSPALSPLRQVELREL